MSVVVIVLAVKIYVKVKVFNKPIVLYFSQVTPFSTTWFHRVRHFYARSRPAFGVSESCDGENLHYVKYQIFTWFCGLEILWKGTISWEFRATNYGNCAFPQNVHTRKLDENSVFYIVLFSAGNVAESLFIVQSLSKYNSALSPSESTLRVDKD